MTPAAEQTSIVSLRPRFDGSNIRTWIGFKQLMYMAEEAVLNWFRKRGVGPQRLYHQYGLGLEVIDSSALFHGLVEIDDEVMVEVTQNNTGQFSVTQRVARGGVPTVAYRGRLRVALIPENHAPEAEPVPREIQSLLVPNLPATDTKFNPEAFQWSWRAQYFHCHYSDRVQHSAYIRALEEVVDRFLTFRGISIRRMLDERSWIPVVSRARVRLLAAAHMDETIHTNLVVEDVLKGTAYNTRMDCYVQRDGLTVHTATARLLQGYAVADGEAAGQLAELDQETIAALTSEADS